MMVVDLDLEAGRRRDSFDETSFIGGTRELNKVLGFVCCLFVF